MLARRNKVTQGADYRRICRRGRRAGASVLAVFGEVHRDATTPTRFGFIITKRVGVAVVRNRLRRQLKGITRELLHTLPCGASFVIRLFPEAATASYEQLREQVHRAVLRLANQLEVGHSNTAPEGTPNIDVPATS